MVDDNELVRMSLAGLLEKWNYEVSLATNCQEAFDSLKKENISAVLLDIRLGDENGFDVLKAIKDSGKNMPVVVMTAFDKDYNQNHFFDQGAIAFLIKPIQASNLKDILNTCIKQEKENQALQLYANNTQTAELKNK